jgi:hypothetical protein
MGQMIKIVKEEIASLFSDHPLSFLNERDVVSEFHRRLLTQYPETVTLTVRTLSERFPSIHATKFITKRVHQEVATEGMGRGKRVDIAILRSGEAELVGYNYRPGIPSTIFRDQDVIGAIEVKFFRDTEVRPKILRAGELRSYEDSISKLGLIKRRNPRAFCAFVVFSHCCLRFREDQEERLNQLSRDADLDLVFRSERASFGS